MSINFEKKKIIFFINTITSYQDDFFTELNKYLDVKVFFYNKLYKNYNFKIKKKKNYYFLKKSKKNIIRFLKLSDPDFIVLGGYRVSGVNQIIKFCKKTKKKYFFWLERLNEKQKLKFIIVKLLISKRIKDSNGILAVGEKAKKFYKKFNSNVINLPYSINVKNYKKKIFFHNKKINFVFVGQIIKRKGIDLLLNCFSNLSINEKNKITLTIVGNGLMKKFVKKVQKENKFINYYEFLNKKKLNIIYQRSDVFIFPSIFDGWGVAPLEAMNFSNSLIISNDVGMKEILINKKQVVTVSKNRLSQTVKKLINNKLLIKKNGTLNRQNVLQSFCNVQNSTRHLFNYLCTI